MEVCIVDLLKILSNDKWINKIKPMNDVEEVKDLSLLPFSTNNGKRTIFADHNIQLAEEFMLDAGIIF